jgi:hypothetical protein
VDSSRNMSLEGVKLNIDIFIYMKSGQAIDNILQYQCTAILFGAVVYHEYERSRFVFGNLNRHALGRETCVHSDDHKAISNHERRLAESSYLKSES